VVLRTTPNSVELIGTYIPGRSRERSQRLRTSVELIHSASCEKHQAAQELIDVDIDMRKRRPHIDVFRSPSQRTSNLPVSWKMS
jgi:hypothetical protein